MSALNKRVVALLLSLTLLSTSVFAQISVPNTLVAGTTVKSADLNTNFTTIANHALDRLSGGNIAGNITFDAGITIDGVDVGAALCSACAATFASVTVNGVGIIPSTGKIPAISSTYFTSLSGTSLTGVALLGTANAFTARNDFLTYTETKTAITPAGSLAVDLSLGSHFTLANTTTGTVVISNPPSASKVGAFTIAVTANGSSHPITWPASVKWAGGVAPTLTTTNAKLDLFSFISYDGGTTWIGLVGGQNF